jgi:hypothetical protein
VQARVAREAAAYRAEVVAREAKLDNVVTVIKVFVGIMLLTMILLFLPLTVIWWDRPRKFQTPCTCVQS